MSEIEPDVTEGANPLLYAPALVVLVVVCLGVPFLEIREGTLDRLLEPINDAEETLTRDNKLTQRYLPVWSHPAGLSDAERSARPEVEIKTGEAARALEVRLNETSYIADLIRPSYLEFLYRAFRRTSDRVVAGGDRWLFQAASLRDYPPRARPDLLGKHLVLLPKLSQWFESRGIAFLTVCVPTKWSIYPEHLPHLVPAPHSVEPEVQRALAAAGVWSAELRPLFQAAKDVAYYSNDTHFSEEGADLVAREVARLVRERFPNGVPGEPLEILRSPTVPVTHEGDLQHMLGFERDSPLFESFLVPSTLVAFIDVKKGALLDVNATSPLVWCGTSYSLNGGLALRLSAELGRRVEDRAVPGKGPMVELLKVVQEIKSGAREKPQLIVWEFPEKHIYLRERTFLFPMGDFLSGASEALDKARAEFQRVKPAKIKSRTAINVTLEDRADGGVSGVPTSGDPQLIFELEEAIPADGSWALHYTILAEKQTYTKILFDFGGGITGEHTAKVRVPKNRTEIVVIPVTGPSGSSVQRFRLDPVDSTSPFVLGPLNVATR